MKHITGDELQAIRKYGRKTIAFISQELGISVKTLMNWEKGVGTPNTNQFINILKLCEVDSYLYIDQLMNSAPDTVFDARFINDLCNKKGKRG
ncbi:helix-turn-helix transcriptional regulator [Paraneptunicella aestuarii]|uniref:helix-turn-helix domain-containing protein n=1 Tax=Paraneptunicella aestuarii TaxID=2831148 RepID=UPI001E3F4F31|nr:helix-turn-helix transcriptional regulator [Paraneptunicella aestuarii]UAA37847.1 helix-turn-helix transcriptional regulator [Paraneptunicella aestuarii]